MRITKQQLNQIIIETGKLNPGDIPGQADYDKLNLRADIMRDRAKDRRAEDLSEPLPSPSMEVPHALDKYDDVSWDEDGLPYRWDEKGNYVDLSHLMEYKMRITKQQLKRVIREETRKLREDHIDTELDHLKKNIADDLEHVKDLKDDIKDDHEEELRAEEEKRKHEGRVRRRNRMSYRQIRQMIREEHQGYDAREDESLAALHGPASEHEQDYKDRRDDAGFEERTGNPASDDKVVHHYHHHDKQGYDAREDERLAAEHGAEADFDQSLKDRRDDAGFENESRRRRGRKLREAQLRRLIRRVTRRR